MKRSSPLSLFALGLLLAACCANTPGTPLNPNTLMPVRSGGETLIDESLGNCPINEFEVPGEGLHVVGTVGGLAVYPFPDTALGNAQSVRANLEAVAQPSEEVPTAILVVDDFNGEGLEPGVYFPDQEEGNTLGDLPTLLNSSASAQERALEQEPLLDTLEAAGQVSHGALVFNHTLALVSGLEVAPVIEQVEVRSNAFDFEDRFMMQVATFPTRPDLPVVAAVDTEDFNTGVIANRVEAAVSSLIYRDSGDDMIARFAVNFSFGLVPCSVLRDFEALKEERPALTFEGYQAAVLEANGYDVAAFRAELARVVNAAASADPLRGLTQSNFIDNLDLGESRKESIAVTYLAAAGNYRLDYSLYPGLWPEIVSVSASDVNSPDTLDARYSDTGEVLLPGGFFELSFFDPDTNDWQTYSDVSVAGTSFAAPALSVFTAFDYSNENTRCLAPGNRNTKLAFYSPGGAQPAPNLPLREAVAQHCD